MVFATPIGIPLSGDALPNVVNPSDVAKRASDLTIRPKGTYATILINLYIENNKDVTAIRVKNSVVNVIRLEDGLLHVLSSARDKAPTRAVDFLIESNRADAQAVAQKIIEKINSASSGAPTDQRKVYWDDEDNETPIVIEIVEISDSKGDYGYWDYPNSADAWTACVTTCTDRCVARLSGTAESIFCTLAAALGAALCVPGVYASIACGAAAGSACYAATEWVRDGCPYECVTICSR